MTYAETARHFANAESPSKNGRPDNPEARAAAHLPMSEWAESRRHLMSPQTIAANHAMHVSGWAEVLRRALIDRAECGASDEGEVNDRLAHAAHSLLTAIGEQLDDGR